MESNKASLEVLKAHLDWLQAKTKDPNSAFYKGKYTFHKRDWELLNDPNFLGDA
tara:strand:- start:31 stop:192 length:162 start_codon:yes stop_codon:yes gene_type:complete